MKQPLVTIIIPSYNYAGYVAEAVDSALGQSYDNVEVIVINDGSTDDTDSVLQQYAGRVQYISRENKGIIATRNEGLSLAKGEYVMQLDADDVLDKNYVKKTVVAAEKYKADIVYTQAKIFGRLDFTTKFIQFDLEKLKHDNFMHASALVRRKVLSGHSYDSYLDDKGNEDWDLFLDLCMDGATAYLVDEPLLLYRKHEDHSSRSDTFEGTTKELLVRHHILNKQNSKHPKEFWYFSSQIDLLYKMIKMQEKAAATSAELVSAQDQLSQAKARIVHLEARDPVTMAKKIKRRVLRAIDSK